MTSTLGYPVPPYASIYCHWHGFISSQSYFLDVFDAWPTSFSSIFWHTVSPRSQSRKEMWLTGEKYDWLVTWSWLGTAKWLTATCREYDWRRRLCISFVVCYCVSYAVHDIVSGRTALITCSEYSFTWSCLNLGIICKQFTNVNCN